MDIDDLVLAIVDACNGTVEGRTRFQKVGYFVSQVMGFNAGYEPHYYGPYSEAVAAAIQGQVSRDLLQEQVETFVGDFVGHDFARKRYKYTLTDRGRRALQWRKDQPTAASEYRTAQKLVAKLTVENPPYKVLSWAAKLYLILLQEGGRTTPRAAREVAEQRFRWQMSEAETAEGLKLLADAGLVKT